MKRELDEFSSSMSELFRDNFVAAVLYGSSAKSENILNGSDANIIVVLKDFSLDRLSLAEKIVKRGKRKADISCVFYTENELKTAADVFPVEFADIKENYRILAGRDVVAEISVDTKNLRHQLEFEMRSKLLKLRGGWLNLKGSRTRLFNFLTGTGTSFLHLFNYAQKLSGGKLENSLTEPYKKCIGLKKKEIRLDRAGLENLYRDVHDSVSKIIARIDEI